MRILIVDRFHPTLRLPIHLLTLGLLSMGARGAETISKDNLAFFESKIRPLLAKHCYECHSEKAEKLKGNLLLDSADGIAKGGDSGDVIEPGDPSASLLMKSVRNPDPDEQMPPKQKLADSEIEALETWIRIGAPDPRKGGKAAVAQTKLNWTMEEGRKHWAFQPLAKPPPTGKRWV